MKRDVGLRVPASCRPKNARGREKTFLSESIEEYVEGIYRLEKEYDAVGTGEISRYMNVAPASVTTMLKKLNNLKLVEHTPYHGVKCTPKGEALAIELLRRHRLIERLLVDFLGLPWDGVHDLACKLEHYISTDVAGRLSAALGHPKTCPHGNPVDEGEDDGSQSLWDSVMDQTYTILKITNEREDYLTYLKNLGLLPGTQIYLKERTPFGDVMSFEILPEGRPVSIGREVAIGVWAIPLCDSAVSDPHHK